MLAATLFWYVLVMDDSCRGGNAVSPWFPPHLGMPLEMTFGYDERVLYDDVLHRTVQDMMNSEEFSIS